MCGDKLTSYQSYF